ncbi:hypothetical protein H0I76_11535 [Limibaculum sp. M0105]|uniref:Uncharacterized protein n=1 Tax=Thermohalobaculum xanthum TaxID=2753746 RepID=A0A8J7SEH5_9RHOB|nr:hypothetical protein [Thermohalobaculum xanthum]MBK0399823.1 hypothetical protein [Thermohalobaculum xanthum]
MTRRGDDTGGRGPQTGKAGASDKAARLAGALRRNLRLRKAQARARKAADDDGAPARATTDGEAGDDGAGGAGS